MCAQMERLVDAGFEDVEMHYWGMCALRNLCRQQDNRWGGGGTGRYHTDSLVRVLSL